MSDTHVTSSVTDGSAAVLPVTSAGSCCGSTPQATAAEPVPAAVSPCCGTSAEASAEGSCCASSAKTEAVASGATCCDTGTDTSGDGISIREQVRARYADAATRAVEGAECGSSTYYGDDDRGGLPEAALRASLGCGNPLRVADLNPGETVLDLGSGGGIDVLLSAGCGSTGRPSHTRLTTANPLDKSRYRRGRPHQRAATRPCVVKSGRHPA
jgi:hypothetical protein